MTNIQDSVNTLIKAIRESNEYKSYEEIKLKINEDKEVKKRLDEFRKQRFILESQNLSNSISSQEQLKSLQDMYSALMMNSDISSFIQSEINLSKMMLEIYKNIGESLEFDLELINN